MPPSEDSDIPVPQLSFQEAQHELVDHFDLSAALEEHVRLQRLSGRLAPGQPEEDYRAFLRTATISTPGLTAALQLNRPLAALFRTAPLTPAQAFSRLGESGVQTYDWTSGIAGYCPIDPSTQQPPTPSGTGGQQPPRLLLTPDDQEVLLGMIGTKSPDEFLAQMQEMGQNGTSFLDPQGWMEFFLLRVHRGLAALKKDELAAAQTHEAYKLLLDRTLLEERNGAFPIDQFLPDVRTGTLFPDVRNNAGCVLGLRWDPHRDYRSVRADGWDPDYPFGHGAPRLLFG